MRLGRYDEHRVRQRMRDEFDPHRTRIIVIDGADVGCIAVRDEAEACWIEHFYLAPAAQGQGAGSRVLGQVLAEREGVRLRINVLQGSPARRLYERHGFVVDSEDPVDVYLSRPGRSST